MEKGLFDRYKEEFEGRVTRGEGRELLRQYYDGVVSEELKKEFMFYREPSEVVVSKVKLELEHFISALEDFRYFRDSWLVMRLRLLY